MTRPEAVRRVLARGLFQNKGDTLPPKRIRARPRVNCATLHSGEVLAAICYKTESSPRLRCRPRPALIKRGKIYMPQFQKECAAMAAAMLDQELLSIIRKMDGGTPTPLQRAVLAEACRRNLPALNAYLAPIQGNVSDKDQQQHQHHRG